MASMVEEIEFEPAAESLAEVSCLRGPIQHPAWLDACIEAFGAGEVVKQVAVGDAGEGSARGVLTRRRGAWWEPWRLPGVDELNEPMDLHYESTAALEQLARKLVRQGTAIKLSRIRADSPTIDALRRAVGRWGTVIVRPQATYPYIALDSSWATPEDKLSSRRRSDHRRALKRAEELGPVRSQILKPQPHELDELLELALAIEARSWKGEAGTALLRDQRRAAFFRGYTRRACELGILRINLLRIGEQSAAMQIAVEQDGGLWLLKVGYDPEFARCSPGNLLIADTIKYAVDTGLHSYEFLGTSEAWTRVWTETERETVCVRVYPLGWRSLAALAKDGLTIALRRLRRSR